MNYEGRRMFLGQIEEIVFRLSKHGIDEIEVETCMIG
jgi:hypothetical protein